MPPTFQTLTLNQIDSSPEIAAWLSQFKSAEDRLTAKQMLLRLRFVSSDRLSLWLRQTLDEFSTNEKYAIFAVRKLEGAEAAEKEDKEATQEKGKQRKVYFDEQGLPPQRPSGSQGSEDLINSVISNYLRGTPFSQVFFDHPSIEVMRSKKIRHLILMDDSIGSGSRIAEFINAMLANKTFRSWWSFGWLKITVLSYARNISAENLIYGQVGKKDRPYRKYRNKDKISFNSAYVYKSEWMQQNWGEKYEDIQQLCESATAVSKMFRLGYKNSFSNIIFLHSVPNNIPGVLYFSNPPRWNSLMPYRSMPQWLITLLARSVSTTADSLPYDLSAELKNLLQLIKSGIRAESTLALRLNLDVLYAGKLVEQAISLGLLTQQKRLTDYARETLHCLNNPAPVEKFDYQLYIPSSWRVG